jgi:hypothetical protein
MVSLLAPLVGGVAAQDGKTNPKKRRHDVPTGTYTSIVVTGVGSGETFGSSVVTIKAPGGKSFVVNGEPGKTTVLEFRNGWVVQGGDVTIEIAFVQPSPPPGPKPSCPTTVFGCTPTGPVEFPERP